MANQPRTVVIFAKHMEFRKELVTAHNVLRRSLESIVERAPLVTQKQEKHFLLFCNTFLEVLLDHNAAEDSIILPLLMKPCELDDSFKSQVRDHHKTLMKRIGALTDALQQPFNGDKVALAAIALKRDMLQHLAFMEAVFEVAVIARANTSVIDDIHKRIAAVRKAFNPFTVLPFFISHLTADEADLMVFNSSSWFVKDFLFPLVLSRKHKKAWAFASPPQLAVSA